MARIKFCGMTNLDDCMEAVDLSVDFIGFVFYVKSRRYILPARARRIIEKLDGKIKTVGVFVEESDDQIADILDYCSLDFAQVYRPSSIINKITVYRIADRLPDHIGEGLMLFDTYAAGYGGSGTSFDFSLLKTCPVLDRAFVAGGINSENVEEVLRLNPFGVDLVSSIESSPGKKDHRKMELFVNKVRGFEI
ncbi:MAG: N-(5'-phosphoribosyl)anthranilate isomerase [Syntrophorhabdaceae bacterium PtaU1.Bin034]|nr:MAG: N-(5'-phosphoribosyl)anthranilate isomerase [Syntrophorhabdaceae bacterium PtaU1.Bin034]